MKDKQQEGRERQIDFTVTGISNYISHIFFQQMFQHKTVAESHGSWKVQLPLFLFSETISLGLLVCVIAPNSPTCLPSPCFWMDGLKTPWDAPWEALREKRVCLLFSTIPAAAFFYLVQKSILGLTTSHTLFLWEASEQDQE